MKTFKVSDVANAIRKDGLPQTKGWFFRDINQWAVEQYEGVNNSRPIASACALGMAAINLSVYPPVLNVALNVNGSLLGDAIVTHNDEDGWSFDEIADWLDKWAQENNDPSISVIEYEYPKESLVNLKYDETTT